MEQEETADYFLKVAKDYSLGSLLTEKGSKITEGLSQLSKNNLTVAINKIKQLDIHTLEILGNKKNQLYQLYRDINLCLESNGRIFICGCGATGRLSLVLETLWRQQVQLFCPQWKNQVISFMAGGDTALIKSIEDFQDHPQFAEQQLIELGFQQNDLLIGSTEGGETPWVIGAIWKATKISNRKPYILYGNPDQILIANVLRSKQFIESDKINKINCNVGEMALSGSTRMQSTTILMHGIGISLLGCDRIRNKKYPQQQWYQYAENNLKNILQCMKNIDLNKLVPLIQYESQLYQQGLNVTYCCSSYYAISILTDTTQRSPTFSLTPFPNRKNKDNPEKCWCTLNIMDQTNQKQASDQYYWKIMLANRQLRCLDSLYWSKYHHKVSTNVTLGFDLHINRINKIAINYPFQILAFKKQQQLFKINFPALPKDCRLCYHSVLKMLLNNISTLIMGRMNRYYSNVMTFVKPTNYKLIDRATRYVLLLRPQSSYDKVVRTIYKIRNNIQSEEPIVLKVIQYLNKQQS